VRQFVRQSFGGSCGFLHPSSRFSDGVVQGREQAERASKHTESGSTTEGEGFEPSSDQSGLKRFSRPPHSTALPPLLGDVRKARSSGRESRLPGARASAAGP
jgi:hypothetical protein